MLCAGILPAVSHAGPEDPVNFIVGGSIEHDDNLFRLSSNAPAPRVRGTSSKSDTLYTTYAGIRVDKPYGLQRFQLDVTGVKNNYRTHSYLNFSAVNYRAAWLWAVSPRLTGTLSADRNSELESFTTLQNNSSQNKRTTENRRFTADWWVDGGWHLIGGASWLRSEGDNTASITGNYTEDTAEGGVRYVSAANNSIAFVQRATRGHYMDRTLNALTMLDTDYDQRESEVRGTYQLAGHSRLDGRLAHKERDYENYSRRDFSGMVGNLSYLWTPTGKLRITALAGRDLLPYLEQTSSYYSSDFVNVTPEWLLTAKTTLRLRLGYYRNDYHGAIVAVAREREDSIRSAQLGVAWRPLPTVLVDAYVTREHRSSNISGLTYDANIIGVAASGTF